MGLAASGDVPGDLTNSPGFAFPCFRQVWIPPERAIAGCEIRAHVVELQGNDEARVLHRHGVAFFVDQTFRNDLADVPDSGLQFPIVFHDVDWHSGDLWRIDPAGDALQAPRKFATLVPPLDNLAIGPDDTVYVSRPAHSAIETVDPETGEIQTLVDGNLSLPGGLAITSYNGREALVVADGYGYRLVDTETGAVTTPYDLTKFGFPSAATDLAVNHDFFVFSDLGIRPRVYLVDRTNFETVMTWTKIKMPYGMVLKDNGDPIVTDFATGTLIALSRTDRKLRDVVADELDGPVGVAWAGPGIVYLTEALGGKLVRINLADGSKTLICSELSQPEGITVLTDGRVAVVEVGKQRLIAVDPVSGAIDVLATELPVGEPAARLPAPVYAPSGVAQGPDGSIYLTGDWDNSVLKLVSQNP